MEFDPVEKAKQFLRMYNEIQAIGDASLYEDLKKVKPYNHEKPEIEYSQKNAYLDSRIYCNTC